MDVQRTQSAFVSAVAGVLLALVGCGASNTTPTGEGQAATPGGAAQHAGMPVIPEANAIAGYTAVPREASSLLLLELLGDQYVSKSDNATADEAAHTLQLDAGPAEHSWAMYGFDGLEQLDEPQALTVNLGHDVPEVLWIALADYAAGAWQWFQVAPQGGSAQLNLTDGGRYINAAGTCYALLAVWDNAQATINSLQLTYWQNSVQAGGWWPMFGYDRQHTSRSPNVGPDSPVLKWSLDIQHKWNGLAIADNGVIYTTVSNRNMSATSPRGELLWTYATDGWIVSDPALGHDGTVYFSSLDDYLYALNPDGSLRWKYDTGGYTTSSPVIAADGTVYSTGVGGLYAFEPGGDLLWQFSYGGEGMGCPAIAPDGTVYFSSWDLFAVNPDGTMKWCAPRPVATCSSICIGPDGTVYCSVYNDGFDDSAEEAADDPNREMFAVSPAGEFKWSLDLRFHTAPAIAADGTLYFVDLKTLYAINPDSTIKWTYPGISYSTDVCLAVDGNGTLYAGISDYNSAEAKLLAFNPDGSVKWSQDLAGSIGQSGGTYPVIGPDNLLIVAAKNGQLLAFGPQ